MKIWAVMCGALRMEFEFMTTLCRLCDMRYNGVVSGIILSTWTGEIDRIPQLREKLKALDIVTVETEPINETPFSNLNYIRQAVQLNAALDLLTFDTYVLKCRTDFSNFDLNRMDSLYSVADQKQPEIKSGSFQTGLQSKISVLRYSVSVPFSFHDVAYLGHRNDLKRLIQLENTALFLGEAVIPDIWFFAGYYVHRFPVLADFFRHIKAGDFKECMNTLQIPCDGDIVLPNVLNKVYALYFKIIASDFTIYHDTELPGTEEISLTDILLGENHPGLRKDWVSEIRSSQISRIIVEGRLKQTEGYRRLYAEIQKMDDRKYVDGLYFSDKDWDELSEWGKNHFGKTLCLKSYDKLNSEGTGSEPPDFEKAVKTLMADSAGDKEVFSALEDISFQKSSYYDTVISYLKLFSDRDEDLYKKALFSATRYFNEDVLYRVAELLVNDELDDPKEIEAAVYIFKRFQADKRLYPFPMPEKHKQALLMYCQYEEKNHIDSCVRQEFNRRMAEQTD